MPNFVSEFTGLQIEDRLTKAGTAVQPEGLNKTAVGLSNVDNTSDASKPISTATQQALDGKSDTDHTHAGATTSTAGFMSETDKTKLDGVEAGANNYSHPASHPASMIAQDASNRFVTDAEKAAWNAKEASGTAATAMSAHTGAADPHSQYLPKAGGTASGLTLDGGYTEEVFAVTGTTPALSPTDGSIQTWTLTGNSTPTLGTWGSGQSMTLLIDDGTAYSIDWALMGVVWKTDGGTAPVLLTTGFTALALVKVGTTVYGWKAGDA